MPDRQPVSVAGIGGQIFRVNVDIPTQMLKLVLIGAYLKSYPDNSSYAFSSTQVFINKSVPVTFNFTFQKVLHMPNSLLLVGWSHLIGLNHNRL